MINHLPKCQNLTLAFKSKSQMTHIFIVYLPFHICTVVPNLLTFVGLVLYSKLPATATFFINYYPLISI